MGASFAKPDVSPCIGKSAINLGKILSKPFQVEPNTVMHMKNSMVLKEESMNEDPIYSTAIQTQKDASSKDFNHHMSAILSLLIWPKVYGKDFEQFIGVYKRFQETKKFDKLTFSKADRGIDGPERDHLFINMKPGRVPGLTGDIDIPQRHKIPNVPIQNGQEFSEDIIENLNMEKYYEEIFEIDDGKHFQASLAPPQTVLRESKERNIPNINKLEKPGCSKVENSNQRKKLLKTSQDDTLSGLGLKYPGSMGEIDKLSYQKRPLHVITPEVPDRLPYMRPGNHFLNASSAKPPNIDSWSEANEPYIKDSKQEADNYYQPQLDDNDVENHKDEMSTSIQGKTPIETSCPYDKTETTTPSPNSFLDEIPPRIPDSRVFGTDLEEISRSTGDYHEFQENRRAYGKCNFSPSGKGLF